MKEGAEERPKLARFLAGAGGKEPARIDDERNVRSTRPERRQLELDRVEPFCADPRVATVD